MAKILVLPFNKLNKSSVGAAGGKGASLGEMTRAGLAVPPGFVVLAEAFERFLAEADIIDDVQAELDKVNYQDTNSIDGASVRIRGIISQTKIPKDIQSVILDSFVTPETNSGQALNHHPRINACPELVSGRGVMAGSFQGLMPKPMLKQVQHDVVRHDGTKFVAVRSSATAEDSKTASWAGELETYLFVTRDKLLDTVKECWSSLFTPRAIFYRHEKKLLKTKVSVAVVVQKMINSEVSGIAFTVHPVTKDKNQMIIEAGYGLGEAIVQGAITPDSYIIDKREGLILDVSISKQEKMMVIKGASGGLKWTSVPKAKQEKQKLAGPKIMELAALCQKIEKHYGHPQDIEWALERGRFYTLQSRPITTL